MANEGPCCDVLWMPGCPSCSWISLARPAREDRLDQPHFHYARNTSAKYGHNHFILTGCPHALSLGCKLGPRQNRLKMAVAWRCKVNRMGETLFRVGYTAEQREEIFRRLGHPELQPAPVPAVPVPGNMGKLLGRLPYRDA